MSDTDLSVSADIQGIFFRGYVRLDHAAYGFFRVSDRAAFQDWLGQMLDWGAIVSANQRHPSTETDNWMNIAFTAAGLKVLLGDGYIEDSYDHAFAAGMVAPERSRILGDVDENDPSKWAWGGQDEIHGVLMSFSSDKGTAGDKLAEALCQDNGAELVHKTFARLEVDNREPFGFKDGVSQPILRGTPRARRLARENPQEARVSLVSPGEMIMGYPDNTGTLPRTPAASAGLDPDGLLDPHPEWPERRDFGKNGTYLVFRQLEQDPEGFWNYVNAAADEAAGETGQHLAEKMFGRRMDGTALAPGADEDPQNNNSFDFSDDLRGLHCPIGSHIRRGNNRAVNIKNTEVSLDVTLRHRILRRARVFEEGGATGLQFICFNASIVRQFEFVQSAWCNNSFFQGLQKEVDPIIGTDRTARLGLPDIDRFTVPRDPYRRVLEKKPQFVTVRGGAYFMLPGLQALRFIAQSYRAEQALLTPLAV